MRVGKNSETRHGDRDCVVRAAHRIVCVPHRLIFLFLPHRLLVLVPTLQHQRKRESNKQRRQRKVNITLKVVTNNKRK
jgi:hypothetical protein